MELSKRGNSNSDAFFTKYNRKCQLLKCKLHIMFVFKQDLLAIAREEEQAKLKDAIKLNNKVKMVSVEQLKKQVYCCCACCMFHTKH